MNRGLYRLTGRTGLFACALGLAAFLPGVHAQLEPDRPPVPPAPAQFDPSDVYFQGYLLAQDAEKLAAEKKYSKSLEKYQQAQQLFDRIHKYFPTWRKDMVEARKTKNQSSIDQVAPQALEEDKRMRAATLEFEGGKLNGEGIVKGDDPKLLNGGDSSANSQRDTLATRRIAELEAQTRDLRSKLGDSLKQQASAAESNSGSSRDASRLDDISRNNDLLRSKLQQAQNELNRMQSQQPMREDLDQLNQKLHGLEEENRASQQALAKSRQEAEKLRQQNDALQKERSNLLQKQADLTQALSTERKLSSEVVEGQQKQVRQLQDALRGKDAELQQAANKIGQLENQLNEMQQSNKDLAEERDSLLRERDQLSELLKLNGADQLSQLINQNMDLDKKLREANERIDILDKDGNETKDEYAQALADLVTTKTQINNFKREKQAQEKRLADLETRLAAEDKALSESSPASDPAETEMLRNIIRKLRRQQESRRESSELVMQAFSQQAKADPTIANAMEMMKAAEIPLTDAELKIADVRMAEGHDIDSQIVSPVGRDPEKVRRSSEELYRAMVPYKKAAQRAFINERLESARELLETVTQENPADIEAICSLGVINLRRQDDPAAAAAAADNFRRAVELEPRNPFAQRMLGRSLMAAGPGNEPEAEAALRKAIELSPTDWSNHLSLGNLLYETTRDKEAEDEFKAAMTCEDANYRPYYNLANLYAHQGKKKKGLEFYHEALNRQCPPDGDLEKRLAETAP